MYKRIERASDGSLFANPTQFPPTNPDEVWAANYLVGWQDTQQPIAFPGCFPWLPPGFDILKDGAPMFPDRAQACKANRAIHAKAGIVRSVAEFFPGQHLGRLAGKKVILCGSGPSLGTHRAALERARAAGAVVVAVNGAIAAIPNADIFFALERCSKAEWWAKVDPSRTPIWTSPSAAYPIVEKWPADRRFYFLHHWDVFDGWPDRPEIVNRLPATLSCMVSTINCIQLLVYCGIKELWLLGQDFSGELQFDPTKGWFPGAYYWDGSFPPELHGEGASLTRGIDGRPCATTQRLSLMGEATRVACELVSLNADIPVYNIGGRGILALPSCDEWEKYKSV